MRDARVRLGAEVLQCHGFIAGGGAQLSPRALPTAPFVGSKGGAQNSETAEKSTLIPSIFTMRTFSVFFWCACKKCNEKRLRHTRSGQTGSRIPFMTDGTRRHEFCQPPVAAWAAAVSVTYALR